MTIFFYGPNSYALRQSLSQLAHNYQTKAGSEFGLERIDGSSVRPDQLSAALQASPFLASSRLVVVEDVSVNKGVVDKLEAMITSVPSSTVAVFVERNVDQRTKPFKVLLKADKVAKFDMLTGPKLLAWVRSEAERLGGTIDGAPARRLVELAGEDQWRLSEEINKLVNFSPEVTTQNIQELVEASPESSIFELVDHMTAGRASEALARYREMLLNRESEIYVLTMVQWQLRNLLLAKLAPNMNSTELAKTTGMSPYVAGKAATAQGRIDETVLKASFIAAADCEFDIKSGRTKGVVAVEQLIYAVATSVAQKPDS